MERTLEQRTAQAVDAWLRWLPRWEPASHRGRVRICRICLGSPLLGAAGLGSDVPHGVTHGLSTRLKRVIDEEVDGYTRRNLPLLEAELARMAAAKAHGYRPEAGLDPEYDGLPCDPEPVPGEPFLFTLAELASPGSPDPVPAPLSEEAKTALRTEVRLADECAGHAGRLMVRALSEHRDRIAAEVERFVEPQIAALLADLHNTLDAPPSRWG